MATMYAWSPIDNGKKVIKLGDAVSKEDVGEDWDYLVESRVIRKDKYPDDLQGGESPREGMVRKLAELADGDSLTPPELQEDKA